MEPEVRINTDQVPSNAALYAAITASRSVTRWYKASSLAEADGQNLGALCTRFSRTSRLRLLVMYRRESRRTTSLDLPLPASA
jgi:hypothetical protein